jgi:hypothetical protein
MHGIIFLFSVDRDFSRFVLDHFRTSALQEVKRLADGMVHWLPGNAADGRVVRSIDFAKCNK